MTGAERIAAERARQQSVEGYDEAHDDKHDRSQLACAAVAYVLFNIPRWCGYVRKFWPWLDHWKPDNKNAIRNLEKAGALIAAEIDRLHRTLRPVVGDTVGLVGSKTFRAVVTAIEGDIATIEWQDEQGKQTASIGLVSLFRS